MFIIIVTCHLQSTSMSSRPSLAPFALRLLKVVSFSSSSSSCVTSPASSCSSDWSVSFVLDDPKLLVDSGLLDGDGEGDIREEDSGL